jgi:hypothetical protein
MAYENPTGGISAGGWLTDHRPSRMRAEPISQALRFCLFNQKRRIPSNVSGVGGMRLTYDGQGHKNRRAVFA